MENLSQDVVAEVVESSAVCPIVKKALPIVAPVAVVVAAALIVRKIWKARSAKKAVAVEQAAVEPVENTAPVEE